MDINTRLRRVTDLFVEGEEILLGYDDDRRPVVVWVNKLNSFEIEEARRDGITARGLKMRDLADVNNPERQAYEAEINLLTDDQLREAWVNQRVDELYLDVLDEVEGSEEMREKKELLNRLPTLLADAGASDDDPRRAQLMELQTEYLTAIRAGQEKRQKEALREAQDFEREDLEASYYEKWRERQTLDLFMEERRITEIYVAARECDATSTGAGGWNHSQCDHSVRLVPQRSLVKTLPPMVIEQIIDALDKITSSQRQAGNSDAPVSSSASSEPSSASEAPSIPSSPVEMPGDAPTS